MVYGHQSGITVTSQFQWSKPDNSLERLRGTKRSSRIMMKIITKAPPWRPRTSWRPFTYCSHPSVIVAIHLHAKVRLSPALFVPLPQLLGQLGISLLQKSEDVGRPFAHRAPVLARGELHNEI